jgi:ribosomal protein S15P/S13E
MSANNSKKKGRAKSKKKKKKPGAFVRERPLPHPNDIASCHNEVTALTQAIERVKEHLKQGNNWHSRQTVRQLERLIDQRGKILEMLREHRPEVWQPLCQQLQLTVTTPIPKQEI